MTYPLRTIYKLLVLLSSSIGLFLSLWIVVPAPIGLLLPLGVGAPEISPWLIVLNAIALLLVFVAIRPGRRQRLTLMGSLVGFLLSTLPVVQLPATEQHLSAAMRQGLGADYQGQIPSSIQAQMRPRPFVLADGFSGIDPGAARFTSGIPFATPDHRPLTLDVYQPPPDPSRPEGEAGPAIVVLYGGAWRGGSPAQNVDFNRYMAARGYTVFAIDYRHAPRYRFPAQLEDVRSALAFIRQHAAKYQTNPGRIALLGRSAGAHLAMLAAYEPGTPVRAVVNYYGPVDLAGGYADPPHPDPINVRAVLEAFLGGSPGKLANQYRVASPISYVTQPLPPTLLVYGSRDHVVEAKFGRRFYERLRSVGSTAVLLEIPWAEHAFDEIFNGPSNQLALYYTERFLAWALR